MKSLSSLKKENINKVEIPDSKKLFDSLSIECDGFKYNESEIRIAGLDRLERQMEKTVSIERAKAQKELLEHMLENYSIADVGSLQNLLEELENKIKHAKQ